MNNITLLKIYYEDKTKRCPIPKDFIDLYEIITKSFPNIHETFEIYYMDEEKELILIENQFDFENAIYFSNSKSTTLKITLKTNKDKCENKYNLFDSYLTNNNNTNSSYIDRDSYKQKDEILVDTSLYDCNMCERKFSNLYSQLKHSRICNRVFGSKRSPFQSCKQRRMSYKNLLIMSENFINKINSKLANEIELLRDAIKKWKKETNNIMPLNKCKNCFRNFNQNSIDKHEKNCIKVHLKRKPFDSKKQRISSLEQAVLLRKQDMLMKSNDILSSKSSFINKSKISSRWKKMSDRFRTIIRISKLLYRK